MTASQETAPPPVLELREVTKSYPVKSGALRRTTQSLRAVDGVDMVIASGETLGLVGESGSGKSTLARLAMGTITPTSGSVWLRGERLSGATNDRMRQLRRHAQMVFQDPYSSFDPLATIGSSVSEPLLTHTSLDKTARLDKVEALFRMVGLSPDFVTRYPRQLSGGQLQRAAVARALVVEPSLVVLDEPVSALDVSTQAQLINMLDDLREQLGTSYLFIAHDLMVVRHVSDRIAVMYLGQVVESGPAVEIYERPRHPYTAALLSAIPVANPSRQRTRRRMTLGGEIPSPINPPAGCRFHTRCPFVMDICRSVDPPHTESHGVTIRCHLHTSGPQLGGAPVSTLLATVAPPSESPD